ncbi:MAG: GntR family transcriptional regulator [Spirochaetota bacterium]
MPKRTSSRNGFVKKVLSEQIKEQLMEDLLHKKYEAGDRLVESAIAREFSVSQAPVREAIKSLVEMGLLDAEPYKGITVRSFSNEDLWEVFTVRASLESLAASIAAKKISNKEISQLETILENMIKAAKSGDVVKRTAFNNQFHDLIIKASGHKLIYRLSRNLRFASWSHTTGTLSSMDPVNIAARHTLIIDSLRKRDAEEASKVMNAHIIHSAKNLLENLDDDKSLDDPMKAILENSEHLE